MKFLNFKKKKKKITPPTVTKDTIVWSLVTGNISGKTHIFQEDLNIQLTNTRVIFTDSRVASRRLNHPLKTAQFLW